MAKGGGHKKAHNEAHIEIPSTSEVYRPFAPCNRAARLPESRRHATSSRSCLPQACLHGGATVASTSLWQREKRKRGAPRENGRRKVVSRKPALYKSRSIVHHKRGEVRHPALSTHLGPGGLRGVRKGGQSQKNQNCSGGGRRKGARTRTAKKTVEGGNRESVRSRMADYAAHTLVGDDNKDVLFLRDMIEEVSEGGNTTSIPGRLSKGGTLPPCHCFTARNAFFPCGCLWVTVSTS